MECLAGDQDKIADELFISPVLMTRTYDFQSPPVVTEPEVRTLGERFQQAFVVIPGNLGHDKRRPVGQMLHGAEDLVRGLQRHGG